ncbi:MAG TPA: thiamine pyrophosphate-binding protein, partial [Candidatus Sulfotelmatobacter sp.]|nr:thiamine pyrophosphate-binding protein [Candidatus Sulfotelmatobacter sp.]
MAKTASDVICERLLAWGVKTIYGFPGDGINGFLGALNRHREQIRFVQTRHEEMASFMACAHAKFTGQVGVCTATSGPGAIHLLNGLYDAKLDHQPVVALIGQAPVHSLGGHMQQEVDLLSLYKDVAAEYVHQANEPSTVRHLVDRAIRIALSERTVTCVILPADVQEKEGVEEQPQGPKTIHTSADFRVPRVVPRPADLQMAASVLNEGKKVAILVGQGALGATDDVLAVADMLGAGIAKALLGKAAVPDDIPYCTGSIGLLGTRPSWELMKGCDTLLMVGSSIPYAEFLPEPGKARGVQIDVDARMLSIRYPMEVALVGDSRETLRELLPLLTRKQDRSWQEKIEVDVANWWQLMEDRGQPEKRDGRVRPQGLFHCVSPLLPDDAILSADSGSSADWYARHIKIRRGMK